MAKMERLELDAQREHLQSDVRHLVEKYRSIFEWDVPDIDQPLSDRLAVLWFARKKNIAVDGISTTVERAP